MVVMVSWLSGCGLFGEEEEDKPAELIDFKPSLRIKQVWSAGVGGDSEFLRLALAPASDGSRIYAAAYDGKVAAFDAVKGKMVWRAKTRLPLSGGPAVNGHVVVVGSSEGDMIALDAKNGEELWRTRVASEVLAAPALTDRYALVRTVDGKLIALNLDDGSQAWFALQSVPRLSVRGTAAPVVSKDRVVCGFDNGKVAAYALEDGALLWEVLVDAPAGRTEIDRLIDINATISIVGHDVYAIGYHGQLAALAIESGQILWSRDASSYAGLSADMSTLYATAETGAVFAVARSSGRELWRREILHGRDVSAPAAYGQSVVVGDFEGYLHWFNAANGVLQARMRAGSDRISAAPLVVNDMLYVLTDGGKLYAFRTETPSGKGKQR